MNELREKGESERLKCVKCVLVPKAPLEVDRSLLSDRLFTGVENWVPSIRPSQSAHHSIDALPSLIFSSLSSRHPIQTIPPSGLCLLMRRLGGVMVLKIKLGCVV